MGYSLRDLSGGCWSETNQVNLGEDYQLGSRLTWSGLVAMLAKAVDLEPQIVPTLSMVYLDVLGNVDQATTLLDQVAASDALSRWVLHQIALQQSSRGLFESWVAWEKKAHEGELPAIIRAKAALSRGILFEDINKALIWSEGWDCTGTGKGFARPFLHLLQGDREQAAAVLSSGSLAALLMAAHLEGDHLGRTAQQEDLLNQVTNTSSVLVYEALIELSLQSGDVDKLVKALQARFAALQSKSGFYAESCATTLLLLEHQSELESSEDLEILGDLHAAEAWRHLVSMVRRMTAAVNHPEMLPEIYLKEAKTQKKRALADALYLRAAELLMVKGAWAAALDALPQSCVDPTLSDLASRYCTICLCWLQSWAKLSDHLVNLAPCESNPADRIQLLNLAAIFTLKEPNTARQRLLSIGRVAEQQQDPSVQPLLGALLATHHCLGDDLMVIQLWLALYQRAQNSREKALFTFTAGLTQFRGGDLGGALKNFRNGCITDPQNPVILAATIITLVALKQWAAAAEALADFLKIIDGVDVTDLYRELAYIYAQKLDLPEMALANLQQVIARNPDDPRANLEEAALHLRLERYDIACNVLERTVGLLVDQPYSADLLCQMGEIYREKLSECTAAEDAYRRALELHPNHESALRGLQQVLTTMKRQKDMPLVLGRLLDLAETDTEKLSLLVEIAGIHYQLWQDEQNPQHVTSCIDFSRRALEISPINEKALRTLIQACTDLQGWDELIRDLVPLAPTPTALRGLCCAYKETSRWEELAQVQESLARCSPDEEGKVAARSAAELQLQQLGHPHQAEMLLRWGIDQFQDVEALLQLADLLFRQNRVDDLIEVIESNLPLLDGEEQLPTLFSLAELFLDLKKVPQALQCYEAALKIDSFNETALSAVEPLLAREQRHLELAQLLERRLISVDDGEEELRILLRLGQTYALLEDPDGELRIAKRLHSHSPDKDHVADYIKEVYLARELFGDLARLYNQRVKLMRQRSGDAREISALLVQKGELEYNKLDSLEDAVRSYAAAVIVFPAEVGPLKMIEDLLAQPDKRQRLIEIYQEVADGISDREKQVEILEKAIKIKLQELRDEEGAIALYEQVHELDPSHSAAYAFLEQQYKAQKNYKKLVKLMVVRAGRVPSQNEEMKYLLRAADLCEKTQNVDRAIQLYQRVLSIDPERIPALKALARIFESLERWEEFLKITQRQIDLEETPVKRAILHFKSGSVMETQYHSDSKAMRHYKQAILSNPSCLPALHSLREIHSRRENWSEVIATLKLEVPTWQDEKAKASVLAQIAEIYATKLNDWQKAHTTCIQALESDPENMVAALALFRFSIDQQNYQEAERWGEICRLRIDEFGNQGQHLEFLQRWALVLLRIGRASEAAATLLQLYNVFPDRFELLEHLVQLCREAPACYDFSNTFSALLREAKKSNDSLAVAILSVGCGLLKEQQADVNGALELYQSGMDSAPERFQLAKPMAELLVHLGREDEAIELVQRSRQITDGVSEKDWIDATLWLIELQMVKLEAYDAAAELCQEMLGQFPGHIEALIALAQVETLRNRLTNAAEAYQTACERLGERETNPVQLAQCLYARGLIAVQIGNKEGAALLWAEARKLDPERSFSYVGIARALAADNDVEGAQQQFELAVKSCSVGLSELLNAVEELSRRGDTWNTLLAELEARIQRQANTEELVLLSRYFVREGRISQAIDLLRDLLVTQGDYVPAIKELHQIWSFNNETSMANRAQGVIQLALTEGGEDSRSNGNPSLTKAMASAGWSAAIIALEQHPLHTIWTFFEQMAKEWLPPKPPAKGTTKNQHKAIADQMMEVFGVQFKLSVTKEPVPLFQIHNKFIIVPSEVFSGSEEEIMAVIAMGACAIKTGYGPIFAANPLLRIELGNILAALLTPEENWPDQVNDLVGTLPSRVQRQLQRTLSRLAYSPNEVDVAAASWLEEVEGMCIKMALWVTDDLKAVSNVLHLAAQGPGTWASTGVLFSGDPGIEYFSQLYLSESFHRIWRALRG